MFLRETCDINASAKKGLTMERW